MKFVKEKKIFLLSWKLETGQLPEVSPTPDQLFSFCKITLVRLLVQYTNCIKRKVQWSLTAHYAG